MAGLHYNFFPTDFFYPRTKPMAFNSTSPSPKDQLLLPLQTSNRDRHGVENLQQPLKPTSHGVGQINNTLHHYKVLKEGGSYNRRAFTDY
ncbi:hypothetical protein PRUPE_7G048900 [Prunus persica]|uniref:Uncharacterized protein n=1 Tax=Prunus persica TaxID=3760 RepID=A0A251N6S6_PRUPE|nr:hypothetical protein PRUPE_7G048900 [Prunus persica]